MVNQSIDQSINSIFNVA